MLRVPVRLLAEFVHRRGDLHARLDGRTRAEEGIRAQRQLQQGRAEGYQRERAVTLEVTLAGLAVTVAGRIDGCDATGAEVLVEEFKTTRADPEVAHAHHAAAHWAQAQLYAGLLATELGDGRGFELRLLYCHPQTLRTRTVSRRQTARQAEAFLAATLAEYERWLIRQSAHEDLRNRHLSALAFPFPQFRPFQRAMARRAFRALRDREHLLLEAPTGSGKTAATLYPALRALESAGYRRVIFLTSRTTGALAVRDAAARMDPGGEWLRRVTITAREKACFVPGTPCEPDACPYARGYYDRARAALEALLERRRGDPEAIAEVAESHQVCPFELSLDAAGWSDLVVADYNYVFDPVVRLQRLGTDPDAALLVDESHQLTPRVRDMLSLTLTRREVKAALAESPPEPLARRLRSLDRALASLRREHGLDSEPDREHIIDRPAALLRSLQRFVDAAAGSADDVAAEVVPQLEPACRDLLFNASRWLRSEAWYQPDAFLHLAWSDGRQLEVRLACIDPGPYIRERFGDYGGHVRFSGTVSPLDLYGHLHGEPDAPAERAGNPFHAEQLRVLVVDDVPTYLRQRQRTAGALADLVDTVTAARQGHYLVALPSFEYLMLAAEAYRAYRPDARVLLQTPAMSDAERADFLAAFSGDGPACLGFVVMGGVFGESVDFSHARLAGVVCVGVGLPPPSMVRHALEDHFDHRGLDGAAVAYHQPAMVKVLQMAGRLLRSPDDRGVLCLVDPRFRQPAYRQFFPDHWQPRIIRARQVSAELSDFWGEAAAPETDVPEIDASTRFSDVARSPK